MTPQPPAAPKRRGRPPGSTNAPPKPPVERLDLTAIPYGYKEVP